MKTTTLLQLQVSTLELWFSYSRIEYDAGEEALCVLTETAQERVGDQEGRREDDYQVGERHLVNFLLDKNGGLVRC